MYHSYKSEDYEEALWRQREVARQMGDLTRALMRSPVMDEIYADLKAQAPKTVNELIKIAARRYMLAPSLLDNLCAGLSYLSPKAMVDATKSLFAYELKYRPRRWFGFGGEIPVINRKAACIYARLLRAQAHKRNMHCEAAE